MGAWASTQLGDWQGPKLQDLRSVSKQRGPKELEEKQRTKTENYRARAGAMRGRRDGHTDSVGLSRAGTEVIPGSRDEEGRNRREARADSSKHGERQAQLAPWKLWKKIQFRAISPEIPRQ